MPDAEEAESHSRRPWLAGIISLICPGAGQIYNGHLKKGLSFAFLVSLLGYHRQTPLVLLGIGWLVTLVLIQVAAYFASAIDAVRDANRNSVGPRNRWYVYLGLIGFYFLLAIPGVFLPESSRTFHIPAASMAPSILNGDHMISDLRAFEEEPPKVGDLAIFLYPRDEKISYIKRVIAGPGDTVQYLDKVLSINGKPVKAEPIDDPSLKELISHSYDRKVLEPFLEELPNGSHPIFYNPGSLLNTDYGPVTIPENKYFVLGDNRDRSSDSRIWGFVPVEHFIAKPVYVYFSMDPDTKQIRWNRIGLRLR